MEPQKIKIWRRSRSEWRRWAGYCDACGPSTWWHTRTWEEARDVALAHLREWHGLRI